MGQQNQASDIVDSAVAEGGAYEVIRKRLLDQGKQLELKTQSLNEARLAEFGSSDMCVLGRVRVRTENNCVARDIVQVGNLMLATWPIVQRRTGQIPDRYRASKGDQGPDRTPTTRWRPYRARQRG